MPNQLYQHSNHKTSRCKFLFIDPVRPIFGMWSALEGMEHILIERETIGDNKKINTFQKPNEHNDKLLGFLFMLYDKEEDV